MTNTYKYKYEFCSGDGDSGNYLFILKRDAQGYTSLRTRVPIDYEAYSAMTSPFVTVRLRVTDERNNTFEKKIQLNILDIQEKPSQLDVDVMILGAGGGGGGGDDGNGAPGGSGSQYSFVINLTDDIRWAFVIGSGGKGGLNNGGRSHTTTGGVGGESLYNYNFYGGTGGHAGGRGSSGAGGGGGSATYLGFYRKPKFGSRKWTAIAAAGAGAGGTGRRELPAYPGGGGDDPDFINIDVGRNNYGGTGFINFGDGPGGGGGGAGILGGDGAPSNHSRGASGGMSGINDRYATQFPISSKKLRAGKPGAVYASSYALQGYTVRTPPSSMVGSWWNGLLPSNAGTGGYSGTQPEHRTLDHSNGAPGAAVIRYKMEASGGFPKLKFGGSYGVHNGYHVHVFSTPGVHELTLELE
jgi:hypothetical protein